MPGNVCHLTCNYIEGSDSVSFGNNPLANPGWTALNGTTTHIAAAGNYMLLEDSAGTLWMTLPPSMRALGSPSGPS